MPDIGTDLVQLLLKEEYCHDLALVCDGGERMKVHRVILAARSVVFRTMLDVDMVERNTRIIEIKEFDADIVKEFISFIYSDKISHTFTNFTELMEIGHQYQVFSLVEECSKHLVQTISVDNVAQLGTLAEAFKAVELSQKCVQFLTENFENIDPEVLDSSAPSSLLRKSYAAYRSNTNKPVVVEGSSQTDPKTVDQNKHHMVNFFTNLGDPIVIKENSSISTRFGVSKSCKLSGVGLYINKGTIPVEISLSNSTPHHSQNQIMTMSTSVTSTDCAKPLKIALPTPVNLSHGGYYYKVIIKMGKECINLNGDNHKQTMSIQMENGELRVDTNGHPIQVPVLFFQN